MIMVMSHLDFFAELNHNCAPAKARRVMLNAGEVMFRQGETSPGFMKVHEGRIDLVRWSETGRSIRIHAAGQGETFAEASLFAESCHCDAVASTPAAIDILPRKAVLDALATSPDLAQRFAAYLSKSLMQSRRLLELRATKPLTEGIIARLIEVVDENDDLPEDVPLLSLAQDLDVTAPALYRALARLEKQGRVIRPARGRVRLVS
ncbi:Crp/Fnr family transcriptional regulator [Marivita sp.]|uniref:Crp/Fnr family transcriptional regulator n=1 Tax=Marivita sp. TaxID=2003365 RepID=UPI003F4ABE2A